MIEAAHRVRQVKGTCARTFTGTVLALVSIAFGLAGCSASKVEVSWEYDPAGHFSGLRTFAWVPGAQPRTKDPRVDDPFMVKRLRGMIEQGLARRGYQVGEADSADFLIAYSAALRDTENTSTLRSYAGYARLWGNDWGRGRGWNVGGPPITNSLMSDIGSLNLFVVDRSTGDPIWHSVAMTEVKPDDSIKKRDERLARAIDDMLNHFPPNQAAGGD